MKSKKILIGAFVGTFVFMLFGCASTSATSTSTTVPSESATNHVGMDLDLAIREAATQMEARIPAGTMIALVSVASPSNSFSTQVLTRLESTLVSNRKLIVVDRANLDKVREEQGFQLSGEVDDESAKSIGKLLGAGAIITGSLTDLGDVYSLTLKAINIETATVAVSYLADLTKTQRIETLLATRDTLATPRTQSAAQASPGTTIPVSSTPSPASPTPDPIAQTPPATSVSFLDVAPSYDRNKVTVKNVTVSGVQYRDALVFSTGYNGYSLHNINGRYARISGLIGRVDGTSQSNSTVNLYGDGMLLRAFNLKATDLPVEFSLEVTGIRQLKFEFEGHSGSPEYALINAVLIPSAVASIPVSPTPPATSVSFLDVAPSYDRNRVAVKNVTVSGVQYRDALVFSTGYNGYSLHNLNGRYARFSGLIGRADGTSPSNSTVNLYGDGMLLRAFNLKATDLPVEFSLEVTGIRQLKFEFEGHSGSPEYALINAVLIPSTG